MKFLQVILTASMLFTACGKSSNKASSGGKQGASADASAGVIGAAQHCLDQEQTLCFLEIQKDGKSNFLVPKENYEKIILAPALANAGLPFQPIDGTLYQKMADENLAAKIVYGNKIEITPDPRDEAANARFKLGKKKGGIFKKLSGGFDILSTLLFIGSFFQATNGRDSANVSVHFGTQTFDETVSKD